MNTVLKKILLSQLIAFMYALTFEVVLTVLVLLLVPEMCLLIAPIVLAIFSFYIAHNILLKELVYRILSVLPFGIYIIVVFAISSSSGFLIVEKNDYGLGIIIVFGISFSFIMLILGNVLGSIFVKVEK